MVATKASVGHGARNKVPATGVTQRKDEKMMKAGWDALHQLIAKKVGNVLMNVIPRTIQNKFCLSVNQ